VAVGPGPELVLSPRVLKGLDAEQTICDASSVAPANEPFESPTAPQPDLDLRGTLPSTDLDVLHGRLRVVRMCGADIHHAIQEPENLEITFRV